MKVLDSSIVSQRKSELHLAYLNFSDEVREIFSPVQQLSWSFLQNKPLRPLHALEVWQLQTIKNPCAVKNCHIHDGLTLA